MSDSSDPVPLTELLRQPTILLSCSLGGSRLTLRASYHDSRVLRSTPLWETWVSRPPGHTLAECVEAAMYRVARAGADGLLVPPGWDNLQ